MAFLAEVKRRVGAKKAGYVGALDPYAWGIMPVCIGKACKFSDIILEFPKTYLCMLRFGIQTDTWDCTGNIDFETSNRPALNNFLGVLEALKGSVSYDIPPLSSKKVGGKRLYDLFFEGKAVPTISGVANVYGVTLLGTEQGTKGLEKALVVFEVSKGTYIRGLAKLIGDKLSVPCVVEDLARVQVGAVGLSEAVGMQELSSDKVLSVESALKFLPPVEVGECDIDLLRSTGIMVSTSLGGIDLCRVFYRGQFVGIGKLTDGKLVMKKWL
jgi:tRNA pseudouridine55 synthase